MKNKTITEESYAITIYRNFHDSCETMNETMLTTALGNTLARCNALEVALNMVIKKAPKVLESNVNAHYQILLSGREIVSIREALAEGESPEGN